MNNNLADAMLRYGIGLNPGFFEQMREKPNFPPHNVIQIGETRFRLILAVAGYTRDDIKITLKGEKLTIAGSKEGTVEKEAPLGEWVVAASADGGEPDRLKVHYRGIAYRNFSREFLIGQELMVDAVSLKNGLLEIDLIREVPETEKVKEIPILT